MQLTVTGTIEEIISFAQRLSPPAGFVQPSGGIQSTPPSVDPKPTKVKKSEKTGDKTIDTADKTIETGSPANSQVSQGFTEPPVPLASNSDLALLKHSLAQLITAKGRDEVTKLLAKHGFTKVSEVPAETVQVVTAEAKALLSA